MDGKENRIFAVDVGGSGGFPDFSQVSLWVYFYDFLVVILMCSYDLPS